MKKIFLSVFLVLSLNAQNLEIDKIRTDLYSKSGANVLKKVEISLEFDGNNLKENENKLIDAVNTAASYTLLRVHDTCPNLLLRNL
ncbi:hypothetical protein A8120_04780, partial [Campylobacter jejuni]